MFYVMIRHKPTRAIKIVERLSAPKEDKGYTIWSMEPDKIEATESKIALRELCNQHVKDLRRWGRMAVRMAAMPCAPAFTTTFKKTLMDTHMAAKPVLPTKKEA